MNLREGLPTRDEAILIIISILLGASVGYNIQKPATIINKYVNVITYTGECIVLASGKNETLGEPNFIVFNYSNSTHLLYYKYCNETKWNSVSLSEGMALDIPDWGVYSVILMDDRGIWLRRIK